MQKTFIQTSLNPQIQFINTQKAKQLNQIKKFFTKFLQTVQNKNGQKKYIKYAEKILLHEQTKSLIINFQDFISYDQYFAINVLSHFYRFQKCLNDALTQFMKDLQKKIEMNDQNQKRNPSQFYSVCFDKVYPGYHENTIRNLKCEMLGKLRSITGTVTRVSQVRPQLLTGVFICRQCGRKSEKIYQQYKYTTPKKCLRDNCPNNSNWELDNKESVFTDFQKLRVQEDSSKIPPGSMPRSIQVIVRNQNIQKGQPGDQIQIIGYLNVMPDISSLLKPGQRTLLSTKDHNTRKQNQQPGISGIKGIKQLSYKLCFIANHIKVTNNQFNQNFMNQQQDGQNCENFNEQDITKYLRHFNESQISQIQRMQRDPLIYKSLSQSLFHQIHGHQEIKKALLIQLLGGVHKTTDNKISIRGDLNVLIVGDPSTAKSQFLKCVNKFIPRSVYTNGKTTSAAGLTASVMRDMQSGTVSIEAGALLLADNGICCIDQFDKMQIKDQVAIHEAMEQQTISIAKAGIQATLHARTSILAAANPKQGRYNKTLSLRKNVDISPPIMSRFDLFFIIRDQINQQSDYYLSKFIIQMHINPDKSKRTNHKKPYTIQQIRNYLTIAKKIKPRLTREAGQKLRLYYIKLRRQSKIFKQSNYQVTVRQLQSMIRISQALAKLKLKSVIQTQNVDQAYRLLTCTMQKLQKPVTQLVGDSYFNESQKLSMGTRQQLNERNERQSNKKTKKFVISDDIYKEIKKWVLKLFTEKQTRHRNGQLPEVQLYLTQQDVVAYLVTNDLQTGNLASQNQNQRVKKIYNKIVKKLIDQHYLVVLNQSDIPQENSLAIHPNVMLNQEQETIFTSNQAYKIKQENVNNQNQKMVQE